MVREFFYPPGWHPGIDVMEGIPSEHKKKLSPWITSFLGLSHRQAKSLVSERLAPVKSQGLQSLKNSLGSASKFSVVCSAEDEGAEGYLAFSEDGWARNYLPAPVDKSLAENIINRLKLEKVDGLLEFVSAFDGVQGMPPTCSGGFLKCAEWNPLNDIELPKPWNSAVAIYCSSTGDQMLLRNNGKLAWFCHENGVIKIRDGSFLEFVQDNIDNKFRDSFDDKRVIGKVRPKR